MVEFSFQTGTGYLFVVLSFPRGSLAAPVAVAVAVAVAVVFSLLPI